MKSTGSSRVRPLNPVNTEDEGESEGGAEGQRDEEIDEEKEEIHCGQCMQPPVRIARDPRMPSQKEVNEHL